MVSKTSRGRQKILLEKIEDKGKRSVTFSKRKLGLLNKSIELSTLCGVNIGLILFSEGKRAYSFASPNSNAVFDHFMGDVPQGVVDPTFHQLHKEKIPNVQYMESQIMEADKKLELEKDQGKTLSLGMAEHTRGNWWEDPIEEMNFVQLRMRKAMMDELKMTFEQEKNLKLVNEVQNPLLLLAQASQNQFYQ